MEKEIRIDSINLTIGKKEISLTVAEAKKLKEALEGIFKETIVYQGGYWRYPAWSSGNVQLLGSCTTLDCKNITLTGNSTSRSLAVEI